MKCIKRIKKALEVIAFAAFAALSFSGCQQVTDEQAEEEELEREDAGEGRYVPESVIVVGQ